ncbi:MAG: DMT family transporter [Anaerolineae bacterium]|nr:DMT family transporter [Anaerolineae bacterium]MDW8071146.1 DMT family transporter [Anaerolineae bacterium]
MTLSHAFGVTLIVLATACWSTSGTFIHFILRHADSTPWGLAFWRDLATWLCLGVGLLVLRPTLLRVERRDLPWLALMGSIGVGLMHIAWTTSVVVNGVAVSTTLQANAPIFVAVMARLLWHEPLTQRKGIAIMLSVAGTLLIGRLDRWDGVHITSWGLFLGLAAALTYGVLALLTKKLAGSYHSATVLLYTFGFATLTLLFTQPDSALLAAPAWPTFAYFSALVLLPTIGGFLLYTAGMRRLPVSVASIVAMTEVPFAALVSFFTLGERLDGWQALGATAIVMAVVLLTWPQSKRKPAPESEMSVPAVRAITSSDVRTGYSADR